MQTPLLRIMNDLNELMTEACEAGDFDSANAFAVAGDIVTGRIVDGCTSAEAGVS